MVGCVMEMLGDPTHCITPVKTVEFVEFLVLTLVLWVVLVGDQDTETVCHYQYNGSGQAPMIGRHNMSITIEAWCNCGCHIDWPYRRRYGRRKSYCGNWAKCCAGGSGQGGSGVVRITFM